MVHVFILYSSDKWIFWIWAVQIKRKSNISLHPLQFSWPALQILLTSTLQRVFVISITKPLCDEHMCFKQRMPMFVQIKYNGTLCLTIRTILVSSHTMINADPTLSLYVNPYVYCKIFFVHSTRWKDSTS